MRPFPSYKTQHTESTYHMNEPTKTATLLRDNLDGFRGHAAFYRLDPPATDYYGDQTEYVIVSAANAPFSGPETYIFPATPGGEIDSFGEMDGSYRGGLSHTEALANMGYEVLTH